MPNSACVLCRGLSPRVRGDLSKVDGLTALQGSIPACAGGPNGSRTLPAAKTVYPRVCGGTDLVIFDTETTGGLSPRVRGDPFHEAARPYPPRSIPACAGGPLTVHMDSSQGGVYPRVCGGTLSAILRIAAIIGLSPRVRGDHRRHARHVDCDGSIPACAGGPPFPRPWPGRPWVYPRVCGGTICAVV